METDSDNINHIQRISGTLRLLSTVLLFCLPVTVLLYWLFFNFLPPGFTTELPVAVNQPLPSQTLLLAFLISLIPASVAIYGIINLKKLFQLYENAIVFSEQNVQCLHRLGYTLIYWVFANLVFTMLISITLTVNNPAGERMLVAQFGVSDIGTLIIGAVIILISRVMGEASKLKDEQAYTV